MFDYIVTLTVTYLNGQDDVQPRKFDCYNDVLNHVTHVARNYSQNMNDGFITLLLFTVARSDSDDPYYYWFEYNDATRSFSTYGAGWYPFDQDLTTYAYMS